MKYFRNRIKLINYCITYQSKPNKKSDHHRGGRGDIEVLDIVQNVVAFLS